MSMWADSVRERAFRGRQWRRQRPRPEPRHDNRTTRLTGPEFEDGAFERAVRPKWRALVGVTAERHALPLSSYITLAIAVVAFSRRTLDTDAFNDNHERPQDPILQPLRALAQGFSFCVSTYLFVEDNTA